jgi:nitrogen fixation-related uncharacterized protein
MFYYLPWLGLIVLSVFASVAVFLWAFQNKQFSDQRRARYLPLRGSDPLTRPAGTRAAKELYALSILVASAGAMLLFTLVFALMKNRGG